MPSLISEGDMLDIEEDEYPLHRPDEDHIPMGDDMGTGAATNSKYRIIAAQDHVEANGNAERNGQDTNREWNVIDAEPRTRSPSPQFGRYCDSFVSEEDIPSLVSETDYLDDADDVEAAWSTQMPTPKSTLCSDFVGTGAATNSQQRVSTAAQDHLEACESAKSILDPSINYDIGEQESIANTSTSETCPHDDSDRLFLILKTVPYSKVNKTNANKMITVMSINRQSLSVKETTVNKQSSNSSI